MGGIIPNRELGDQVGDAALIGTKAMVELKTCDESKKEIENPMAPGDFALSFSLQSILVKALAKKVSEGGLVAATVKGFFPASMEVDVEGIRCSVRKVDVVAIGVSPEDIFEEGEEIKLYVLSKEPQPRLSYRALAGPLLKKLSTAKDSELADIKAQIFENAEETAKNMYERSKKEKEKMVASLKEVMPTQSAMESSLTDEEVD